MAGKIAAQKKQEKEERKQRLHDIEENRIEAEDGDLFKRVRAMEDKLQRRGIGAILLMTLFIILSIWLIPHYSSQTVTIDLTGKGIIVADLEGAWRAFENGKPILFKGRCDGKTDYTVPVSTLSSGMYLTREVSSTYSYKVFHADGSVFLTFSGCAGPSYDEAERTCALIKVSICGN